MDSKKVLTYHLTLFELFGILPKTNSIFYTFYGFFLLITVGIGLSASQMISIIFADSANETIKLLLLLCTTLTIAIKCVYIYANRLKLINLSEILTKMDKRIKTTDDHNLLNAQLSAFQNIHILFIFMYYGSWVSLLLQVIFMPKEERFWKSTTSWPYEFAENVMIYRSVLLFQMSTNFFNCLIAEPVDTFGVGLNIILGGHLDVLGCHLRALRRRNGPELLNCLTYYNLMIKSINFSFHLVVIFVLM